MNTLLPWLICALALLSISIKYVIKGRPLYYKFLQVEDSHDHDKLIVENKLVAFSWLSPRGESMSAFPGCVLWPSLSAPTFSTKPGQGTDIKLTSS